MFNRTALLAAGLLCTLAAAPSFGQAKIAVANPAKIFSDIQETKEVGEKMDGELKTFRDEVAARQAKITDMAKQLNELKPEAPQYDELDKKITDEKAAFDTWGKSTQANIQRRQKDTTKRIFDKIVVAISDVAKEKGFDLVLSQTAPELPEKLDRIELQQMQAMLLSRNILFLNPSLDITEEIKVRLDAAYKAGK